MAPSQSIIRTVATGVARAARHPEVRRLLAVAFDLTSQMCQEVSAALFPDWYEDGEDDEEEDEDAVPPPPWYFGVEGSR